MFGRITRWLIPALLLLAIAPAAYAPGAGAQDTAQPLWFPTTEHRLSAVFVPYWMEHDGSATLGAPITEAFESGSNLTQYFENGQLIQKPDSRGEIEVSRVKVGRDLLALRNDPTRSVGGRRMPASTDDVAFTPLATEPAGATAWDSKTGHAVTGEIGSWYAANGGKGRFGRPLSEEMRFGDRTVQWFELGRIEQAADGTITAAPVGLELVLRRGISTAGVPQGQVTAWDPSMRYVGDGTIPNAWGPFTPVSISIPSVGIDAAIEQVPIIDGVMQTPQDVWAVGWYYEISKPGAGTNVVMAGHRDWWGVGPVIFYNLEYVQVGNHIYVAGADGSGSTYEVTEVYYVAADTNAGEVTGATSTEMLTLITCGGSFTGAEYTSRVIVRAKRI